MSTTAQDRLMNDVRIHAPAALDGAIKHQFFLVMDEFMKESCVWQETISFATVVAQTAYDLETEDNTAFITGLLWVKNANDTLVPASLADPESLVLDTAPSVVETLDATVTLTVTDPVNTDSFPSFPAWVYQMYRGVIFDGMIGALMAQPAKPYTNLTLAPYHMRRFRNGCAFAKEKAFHKNVHGAQRWQFPSNFATGRNH